MSVVIGIDPHKGSHAAAAVNGDDRAVAELEVRAELCAESEGRECASERLRLCLLEIVAEITRCFAAPPGGRTAARRGGDGEHARLQR